LFEQEKTTKPFTFKPSGFPNFVENPVRSPGSPGFRIPVLAVLAVLIPGASVFFPPWESEKAGNLYEPNFMGNLRGPLGCPRIVYKWLGSMGHFDLLTNGI